MDRKARRPPRLLPRRQRSVWAPETNDTCSVSPVIESGVATDGNLPVPDQDDTLMNAGTAQINFRKEQ